MKSKRGITLVALVITIIILLILAGITISQLTGSGLFENARLAEEKYKEAQQKEQEVLDEYTKLINNENLPENTPDTEAGTEVKLEEGWGTQNVKYIKTSNGTEVTELQTIATVYAIAVGNGETVPVPKGFYYVGGTLSSGVVISDDSRDRNKYAGVADVPAGAVYNTDGTVVEYTEEQYKNLTNEQKKAVLMGNQFVWIPCTASSYAKYNFGKYNGSWESNTDNGEVAYIEKYGGFYIGRYEAGTSNITLSSGSDFSVGEASSSWQNGNFVSSYASGKITCKAGEIPYYHADYTTAQTMTRAMYATDNERKNSVKSGLITGTMWDVALNYFIAQDSTLDVTNSDWGNYTDTTLTNCKGRYITVNSSNGTTSNIASNTDGARHYGIMTSGSTEDVKKCNIYDMAGNLWEWTEEIAYDLSNNYYMLRGGGFSSRLASSGYPVCYRAFSARSKAETNLGFRPALYIK